MLVCADSTADLWNPNAGNGGSLFVFISGESITSHTALMVTNYDMQSNSAGGGGNCFAREVIVTVVLLREPCFTELYC